MGLSSMPTPSDGMLCVIIMNTALSIAIVKGVVRSILQVIGIHLPSESEIELPPESFECRASPSESYVDGFRTRTPAVRFDSINPGSKRCEQECYVCFNGFEPHSQINRLTCGHLFHKACLERWLNYWHVTCPLCRTPFMPSDSASDGAEAEAEMAEEFGDDDERGGIW